MFFGVLYGLCGAINRDFIFRFGCECKNKIIFIYKKPKTGFGNEWLKIASSPTHTPHLVIYQDNHSALRAYIGAVSNERELIFRKSHYCIERRYYFCICDMKNLNQ